MPYIIGYFPSGNCGDCAGYEIFVEYVRAGKIQNFRNSTCAFLLISYGVENRSFESKRIVGKATELDKTAYEYGKLTHKYGNRINQTT